MKSRRLRHGDSRTRIEAAQAASDRSTGATRSRSSRPAARRTRSVRAVRCSSMQLRSPDAVRTSSEMENLGQPSNRPGFGYPPNCERWSGIHNLTAATRSPATPGTPTGGRRSAIREACWTPPSGKTIGSSMSAYSIAALVIPWQHGRCRSTVRSACSTIPMTGSGGGLDHGRLMKPGASSGTSRMMPAR